MKIPNMNCITQKLEKSPLLQKRKSKDWNVVPSGTLIM